MTFIGTFWALVPALLAIVLALITKEVYSSLFVGIIIGALFVTGFNPVAAFEFFLNGKVSGESLDYGLISVLSDSYNVGIIIFLVALGVMVSLLNKSGGSKAFGELAAKNIHSKVGALIATWFFGVLIFVDDYFNCLTVGSVMRPVTDKYKISRAKLQKSQNFRISQNQSPSHRNRSTILRLINPPTLPLFQRLCYHI